MCPRREVTDGQRNWVPPQARETTESRALSQLWATTADSTIIWHLDNILSVRVWGEDADCPDVWLVELTSGVIVAWLRVDPMLREVSVRALAIAHTPLQPGLQHLSNCAWQDTLYSQHADLLGVCSR